MGMLLGATLCDLLRAVVLQVNEAVNDLLIDEEDFEGLKSSIASFDNFDQVRAELLMGFGTLLLTAAAMPRAVLFLPSQQGLLQHCATVTACPLPQDAYGLLCPCSDRC